MTETSSGNVFADLELPNPEMHLAKAELAYQISMIIKERCLKQVDAGEILGIDQSQVSNLNCGRLGDFSIDRLIRFLNKLGVDIDINLKPARPKSKWLYNRGY